MSEEISEGKAKNEVSYRLDKEICSKPPGTENYDAIVLSDDGSRLSITLGESHE